MGMFEIADSVFSFCDVDGLVRHHLDVLSMKNPVILLRDHVRDPGLAGVEIVPDLLHVESLPSLSHLRLSLPLLRQAVVGASREDSSGGHVIFHVVGLELDVIIGDLHIAPVVHLTLSVRKILPYGILGSRERRAGQGTLVQQGNGVRPESRIRHP